VHILLNPIAHLEGFALGTLPSGILPTPLALHQSLLLIWPHLITLFALVAVCFGIAYIKFMRSEIRA
ncbi:MAG: ABC transporter, partial [Candidatus Binatia bacterium]